MRSRALDRRSECFYARRAANGTYGPGAGAKALLFDQLQMDHTNGKIEFVPDSIFRLVAREQETWCFQLVVGIVGVLAGTDLLAAYLFGPGVATRNLSIITVSTSSSAYTACGEIVLPLMPGDSIQPGLNTTNANANPSIVCIFSGYRVA